jgi:spectinomycin phosphotransferase
VRCPPRDVRPEDLAGAIDANWGLRVDALDFVPKGAGAAHWVAAAEGLRWFVTCDDLDTKPWLGSDRESVFVGLNAAYRAAHLLRETAGLSFVVAPVPTRSGKPTTRLDARHTVALLPYLDGEEGRWGDPLGPAERQDVLELLAELHDAASRVRAPVRRTSDVPGRHGLESALGDLDRVWTGGPYSEPVREELLGSRDFVARWLCDFDELASRVTFQAPLPVLTHGEPHPGNLIRGADGLSLIDWDTVATDRPERDLWMLDDGAGSVVAAYQSLTGRSVDPFALRLYRRAWALSDLAAYVSQLRVPHGDDEDSRKAWNALLGILRSEEPRPYGGPAPEL